MELQFYGAAGEVTGSCHILRIGDYQVLLDCGLIQGGRSADQRNAEPFPFDPKQIDAVVLSHAHIDHCGRLPLLVKRGFSGPIITQNASRDLVRILLSDSAFLQEMDAKRKNRRLRRAGKPLIEPLYRQQDAERACSQLQGHRYQQAVAVVPGVTAIFHDAGHILGSTSVELRLEHNAVKRTIVFSGDLGQYDTPILKDPATLTRADLVLMESTYGSRLHRDRQRTVEELGEVFKVASKRGGNVLIPAFAVGRSQEVLYHLGIHFEQWGLDKWQVFLDSPMAIEASEIYWNYPNLYDSEALELARDVGMPPLPNLHLSKSTEQSMALNRIRSGAIILAGSGMCTGGRILHHLKHNLWRQDCHVVIVGYQAQGSLGRRLVEKRDTVKIHGETIRVRATIHTIGGLSAHGDRDDLARWYSSFTDRPPVYLVHGEEDSAHDLGALLEQRYGARTRVTEPGLKVDLQAL
ncbi:MAG: MBL fold metallo-hydrolase [Lysobacteraceae bacterium]|nr:MAG: MBL fold metallo-hydrolase [Xanthomonadaceae bacterium]